VGAKAIATGHYARVTRHPETGRWELRTAVDFSKDQTYFLWGLTQEQLARTLFPLGGMTKTEVRALAEEFDLPVAKKPESYEICFVPNGDYGWGHMRGRIITRWGSARAWESPLPSLCM
jgi:tRNA-specific 2-thiouridylase